jgi:hypothetical protein
MTQMSGLVKHMGETTARVLQAGPLGFSHASAAPLDQEFTQGRTVLLPRGFVFPEQAFEEDASVSSQQQRPFDSDRLLW